MTRGKELITAYEAAIASNSEFYYICHMNRIDNATVLVDGIVGNFNLDNISYNYNISTIDSNNLNTIFKSISNNSNIVGSLGISNNSFDGNITGNKDLDSIVSCSGVGDISNIWAPSYHFIGAVISGTISGNNNLYSFNPYGVSYSVNVSFNNTIKDKFGSTGNVGDILSATAGGVVWVPSSGGLGVQGPQGVQGSAGSNGNQGLQGLQGLQGAQGSAGSNGNQGQQGLQGSAGSNGNQGLQGLQGSQGVQGLIGNTGSAGSNGNQGFQGRQGFQGLQGAQGSQGLQFVSNL